MTLKPKALTTGYVDGAWWARSRDLSTELPALLAALAVRLGRVERVSYNLGAWDLAPGRLVVNGQGVRLGGFHAQHPSTLDVIGLNGSRLTLLVLPPATDEATAHRILRAAADRDNTDEVDRLLSTVTVEPSRAIVPCARTGNE
ncbi:DUF5994 family protein [Actinophytocola gossypii]|uniref:Uncharacterized protein n=1 Tax=Actinophytocola gossypii TaxID=2812003 RepID=A0ABT2J2G6_9PSEU|nr:DUF5994 family protein [Actinophytocola gossypii]MCT2582035.1 hypothetical protein [Actinophytocola gossypii]